MRRLLTMTAAALALGAACAHAQGTVVSITFDDAVDEQARVAGPVLAAHGMHATFFVNSARIGASGRMTRAQLAQLAADGNEIGGHTLDHPRLPTLSPADQRREICDDRAALQAMGLDVTSFAYPFGASSPATEAIVRECGYSSARLVSGASIDGDCSLACPASETLPPADAFATRAPASIRQTTPLARIEGYVTAAQQAGGGWVQLTFHHLCDGCNTYAIAPADFGALLDWLAASAGDGVSVMTVRDAMAIPAAPAPVAPAPVAPTPVAPPAPVVSTPSPTTVPTATRRPALVTGPTTVRAAQGGRSVTLGAARRPPVTRVRETLRHGEVVLARGTTVLRTPGTTSLHAMLTAAGRRARRETAWETIVALHGARVVRTVHRRVVLDVTPS